MKRNLTNRFSKVVKAYSLLVCFLFICLFGFSNHERQRKDILYYKNDTLQLRKIHVDEILNKINKQKRFLPMKSGIEGNQYTAHWKIENNQLYLIRITNRISGDCIDLKEADTLNLKLAFRKEFVNGLVGFTNCKEILHATDGKQLRLYANTIITNLTDYHFEVENGKIISTDSVVHYMDDSKKLDRKTEIDMSIYLYKLIVNNTIIKNTDSLPDDFGIGLIIVFDSHGDFVSFDVQPTQILNKETGEYLELVDWKTYFLDFSKVEEELRKLVWDEMPGMFEDRIELGFQYSKEKKRLIGTLEGAERAAYRPF